VCLSPSGVMGDFEVRVEIGGNDNPRDVGGTSGITLKPDPPRMSGTDRPRVTDRTLTLGVAIMRGLRMLVGSSTKSEGWVITAEDEGDVKEDEGIDA